MKWDRSQKRFNDKSRVKGNYYVRFCESLGVKFPLATRLRVAEREKFQNKVEMMQRSVGKIKELVETILTGSAQNASERVSETINTANTITAQVKKTQKKQWLQNCYGLYIKGRTKKTVALPLQKEKFEYILESIFSGAISYSSGKSSGIQLSVYFQ